MRKERRDINLASIQLNTGQLDWLPANPRTWTQSDIDDTRDSILEDPDFLEDRPILVVPFGKEFVAFGGNLRREGAYAAKMSKVPCVVYLDPQTEEDYETILRRAMKDNGQFGKTDWNAVYSSKWGTLPLEKWGLTPKGWTSPEGEGVNGGGVEPVQPTETHEDDFNEEEDAIKVRCKPGDIWQLGEHRLMCGDSIDLEQVKKLTGGAKIDMVFTDPPYGMNAVSKSGVLSKRYESDIKGDDDNETAKKAFTEITREYPSARQIWFGANYYTEVVPSAECWIVWDKNNGASDQTDCELAWTNFRSVVRQFTMASEKVGRVHPTQKPVRLVSEIINRFEKGAKYETLLDVFGGSGTTLIAAEQLNRKCYMMELDPHYCDIILARWEKLTGRKAEKVKQ